MRGAPIYMLVGQLGVSLLTLWSIAHPRPRAKILHSHSSPFDCSSSNELGEYRKCICITLAHLVALVVAFVAIFLVTLGSYHHLDGLEQRDYWAEGGACLWLRSWWLWEVLMPIPRGRSRKETLVNCSWLVDSLLWLVLTAPLCRARCVIPISAWATKWVSPQRGRKLLASNRTSGINLVSICLLVFSLDTCPVRYTSLSLALLSLIYLSCGSACLSC
jgi:hypothetical protein